MFAPAARPRRKNEGAASHLTSLPSALRRGAFWELPAAQTFGLAPAPTKAHTVVRDIWVGGYLNHDP